ncbi:hypothetical protein F1D61_18055 [Methylobacterium aquaticum]|nr:hypothetical protein F1D61_18055 [Methylobacterium aquaticum]
MSLEGGLQGSQRLLEPSFEAATRHLRMRWKGRISPDSPQFSSNHAAQTGSQDESVGRIKRPRA